MELKLKNPIAFFDIEATGKDISKDRIIEISIVKILVNNNRETKTLRVNPEMKISKEAFEIHKISNEDLKDKPTFKEIAKDLAKFIEGCDLAGYNSNRFDIPLLAEEFLRADVDIDMRKRKFVDVQTIFHKKEQRTLSAAYKFYCNKELDNAHTAEADAIATYEVLKSQLDKYEDLENDMEFLAEFSKQNNNADFAGRIIYDENGVEVFNFGKNKGVSVQEILMKQPGYYAWMMNGDFPLYTKKILTEIKLRSLSQK